MRAIEFYARIQPDGKLDVPESLRSGLTGIRVRVILLWDLPGEEEHSWQEAGLGSLREGDGPHDALCDTDADPWIAMAGHHAGDERLRGICIEAYAARDRERVS